MNRFFGQLDIGTRFARTWRAGEFDYPQVVTDARVLTKISAEEAQANDGQRLKLLSDVPVIDVVAVIAK